MNRSPLRCAGLAVGLALVLLLAAVPASAGTAYPGSSGIGVGNWAAINSGQTFEYDFVYNGESLPSEVVLAADPGSSVGFNVYTDPQWQALAAGDTSVVPIGKGTSNPYESGNLSWQTQNSARQLFHVQVYNASGRPATFWIALKGNGGGPLYAVSAPGTVTLVGPTFVGSTPSVQLLGPPAPPAPPPAPPAPSVKPIGPQCYWRYGVYYCTNR